MPNRRKAGGLFIFGDDVLFNVGDGLYNFGVLGVQSWCSCGL